MRRQKMELCALRFAQPSQNTGRIGYRPGDNLSDEPVRAIRSKRLTALTDEAIQIEHIATQ